MGFIQPLFQFQFWFNARAVPFTSWIEWIVLILMSLLIVVGAGAFVAAHLSARKVDPWKEWLDADYRAVARRFGAWSIWAGVVGFCLYALTWQRIPILSMRFFFLTWALGFAWWGWSIWRHATREIPQNKTARAAREAYEKWLPKPKK